MKKLNILNKIVKSKLIAVIRADSISEALLISEACFAGGINILEVTFTINGAENVIKTLSIDNNLIVGAGSVLDSETARIAIMNGAEFIVGPNFNKEVAKLCNRYQIPYIPGCMSVNEMIDAMEVGCDIIKLFPGNAFSPSFIKSIKGPLPQINIMPTGGVSLDNINDWLECGSVAIGIGSELTKYSKTNDYEKITNLASQFVMKVENIKK